jgi:glucan phosphoethanolaminetransferase (alkaline phosphatase superfamily)
VFDLYVQNLRYVLDHVERLLNNIDAETVVLTADHGELFGEWGLYSHHACVPHPALRKVPWVRTTANDSQSHNPPIERSDVDRVERISNEKLAALGYLETG